ncbi:hypothetical protein [Dictyobacter formicarum]|uniref:SnoaL-like domain-containing protein n=1 Tax=Dictyobacter formicarum TaxID=2778368 RepID=A0ABQ3VSQ7_9CHLR|nr:hypothetical protein [Dictyobacter formicarum]GHO88729.1 hypothetical protein KSZ_67350 [Dictyobacter formicarum]
MSTNRVEIVRTVITALQGNEFEVAAERINDSFTMTGFASKGLNKAQFLSLQYELLAAMPDLSYNLGNVVRTEEANTVRASVTLTGTHTRDLSLPLFGLESIPATGVSVVLPQTNLICHVEHGQLSRLEFENITGGGLVGLLQQLGSEIPLLRDEINKP